MGGSAKNFGGPPDARRAPLPGEPVRAGFMNTLVQQVIARWRLPGGRTVERRPKMPPTAGESATKAAAAGTAAAARTRKEFGGGY